MVLIWLLFVMPLFWNSTVSKSKKTCPQKLEVTNTVTYFASTSDNPNIFFLIHSLAFMPITQQEQNKLDGTKLAHLLITSTS